MPELPEAETLRGQLERECLGEELRGVRVCDPSLAYCGKLVRGRLEGVSRHGKALVLRFDGKEVVLRLGMTGRLKLGEPDAPPRLTLVFAGKEIHLIDPRRFARIEAVGRLPGGVDPFTDSAPWVLASRARGSRRPLKALLMDQEMVLGFGNIYATEVLYRAGLDPFMPAGEVVDWEGLLSVGRDVLLEAISSRGTTISDWRDLYGRPGEYQRRLAVYGREGKPCSRCGTPIERKVLYGRGTWFCPLCQNHRGGEA